MNRRIVVLLPLAFSLFLLAADQAKIPAMPNAVTSNAVATLKGGLEIYSVMGLGSKKTWDDVLPNQLPFTKDVFDGLLWWANATRAARSLEG